MLRAATDQVPTVTVLVATAPRRTPDFVNLGAQEDLVPLARQDDASRVAPQLNSALVAPIFINICLSHFLVVTKVTRKHH